VAASTGEYKAVEWLLSHGANPNTIDRFNHTPMHHCVRSKGRNFRACAKLLIEHGAMDPSVATAFSTERLITDMPDVLEALFQSLNVEFAAVNYFSPDK